MLFTLTLRIHCQSQLANSDLNIVKDKNDGSLWITNATGSAAELKARELFGFNVGSFAEVVAGPMQSVNHSKHKQTEGIGGSRHYFIILYINCSQL